jgi:hypothetical protein
MQVSGRASFRFEAASHGKVGAGATKREDSGKLAKRNLTFVETLIWKMRKAPVL